MNRDTLEYPPEFGTRTGVECRGVLTDSFEHKRPCEHPHPVVAHTVLASLAQLVEQCFRKAEVPSSNLGAGSTQNIPKSGVFSLERPYPDLISAPPRLCLSTNRY